MRKYVVCIINNIGDKTINSSVKLMVNICQICYDSDYNYKISLLVDRRLL